VSHDRQDRHASGTGSLPRTPVIRETCGPSDSILPRFKVVQTSSPAPPSPQANTKPARASLFEQFSGSIRAFGSFMGIMMHKILPEARILPDNAPLAETEVMRVAH
jgi:hypothetical protein